MDYNENFLRELKETGPKEKKALKELASLFAEFENSKNESEKKMISSQINSLKLNLKQLNEGELRILEGIVVARALKTRPTISPAKPAVISTPRRETFAPVNKNPLERREILIKTDVSTLEKETLKRLRKKEVGEVEAEMKKPNKYVNLSNQFFLNYSMKLLNRGKFKLMKKNISKSNMQFTPASYLSVIFLTTALSVFAGGIVFLFFMLFNVGAELPIVTRVAEGIGARFLKTFWILAIVPLGTFILMYLYPSVEKKSIEQKINQELPFVTIHMSSISGSMIEPSKIFNIILSTKEYPNISKEFTKLINEINVYGYDLVTALKNAASNSPSKKLAELLNGIAVTINSGGSLSEFFDKRANSLLFEYRLEREKYTKSAETFMDIYISVVIAAPMILMLLLMMIKISGLGISISTSMISLIMVLGVAMINIVFLTFLHLKQPNE